MSTEKGNGSRTRAQKYKNRHVYKNDLHDKTPKQKFINSLQISEVCQHCKGVIEWKIKYKKYKPLTQAKTCSKCQQRNIRKAYHVICRDCAIKAKVCPKCLKCAAANEVEQAQPTPAEEMKLKVEMERLIKSFSERKRRAFLRYMNKGKNNTTDIEVNDGSKDDSDTSVNDTNIEIKIKPRIPHSRDELLLRIQEMQLEDEEDFSDFDSECDNESNSDISSDSDIVK